MKPKEYKNKKHNYLTTETTRQLDAPFLPPAHTSRRRISTVIEN